MRRAFSLHDVFLRCKVFLNRTYKRDLGMANGRIVAKIELESQMNFVPLGKGRDNKPDSPMSLRFPVLVYIKEDRNGELFGSVESQVNGQVEHYALDKIKLGDREITFSFLFWLQDEAIYNLRRKGNNPLYFEGEISGSFHTGSLQRKIESGVCTATVSWEKSVGNMSTQRA